MLAGGLCHSVPKFTTVAMHMECFLLMLFCLISTSAINQYTKAGEEKKCFEAPRYLICGKTHKEGFIKGFPAGRLKITNYELK